MITELTLEDWEIDAKRRTVPLGDHADRVLTLIAEVRRLRSALEEIPKFSDCSARIMNIVDEALR